MLALVQRVSNVQVDVADRIVGSIEHGLLVFVCAEHQDTEAVAGEFGADMKAHLVNDGP